MVISLTAVTEGNNEQRRLKIRCLLVIWNTLLKHLSSLLEAAVLMALYRTAEVVKLNFYTLGEDS